jgi:hypothetical protein
VPPGIASRGSTLNARGRAPPERTGSGSFLNGYPAANALRLPSLRLLGIAVVYRPLQTAGRFSTKASIPSAASSSAMLQAMVSLVRSYASAIERSICR